MIWSQNRPKSFSEKKIQFILGKHFGVKPNSFDLYHKALMHKSFSKDSGVDTNERLEFLGDAYLGAYTAKYLYNKYPDANEGELSKLRAKIVSRKNLNTLAFNMRVNQLVYSNIKGGLEGNSVAGNALEALLGAIYLDKGYNALQGVLALIFKQHLDLKVLRQDTHDYKSLLFEYCQKERKELDFVTISQAILNGRNFFRVELRIDGDEFLGEGTSKKKAEQDASEKFLEAKQLL